MENYGCVTWSDAFLSRHEPSPAEREQTAKVLLHEMAHMWFGNIVTMRWWDDLWLNEAFAEFACNWAAERPRGTPTPGRATSPPTSSTPTSPTRDRSPTRSALPVRDVEEAASIFDAITYPKGASVLQQLMTYVGEDAFRQGMTALLRRSTPGANTTLQDLIDELAAVSGRDLDAWREGWLETAGTDRLTLEHGDDGPVLVAHGPGGHGPATAGARHRRLQAGRRRPGPGRAGAGRGGRASARRSTLEPGADLYLVNDDDLTFATARPDAERPRRAARRRGGAADRDLPCGRRRDGVGHAHDRRGGAPPRWCARSRRCCGSRPPTRSSSPTSGWPPTAAEMWSLGRRPRRPPGRGRRHLPGPRRRAGTRAGGAAGDGAHRDDDRRPRLGPRRRPATTSTCCGGSLVRRAEIGEVDDAEVQALHDARPGPGRVGPCPHGPRGDADRGGQAGGLRDRCWPARSRSPDVGQVARALWRPGQAELTGAVRRELPRAASRTSTAAA